MYLIIVITSVNSTFVSAAAGDGKFYYSYVLQKMFRRNLNVNILKNSEKYSI